MTVSSIYIIDHRGKILIGHDYRGDIPHSAAEKFFGLWLKSAEEEQHSKPILRSEDGVNYLYLFHRNIYVVALALDVADAAKIYIFLQRLIEIFICYFKKLEEESIRDNFVVIYELFEEIMDFGYPQTTELGILREYITQQSYSLEYNQKLPAAVTGAVSWRPEGIKYRKNEVFLDVIESLNVLINSNGNILKNEISGVIKVKSYLSGMPDVQLGLNDRIFLGRNVGDEEKKSVFEIDDVKFHQCVGLDSIEHHRVINFVPPDGEFEIMSYRLNTQTEPLILVDSIFENVGRSRIKFFVKIRSQAKRRLQLTRIKITVPVPHDADTPKLDTAVGLVEYVPEKNSAIWSIARLSESREHTMVASFGLPSVRIEEPKESPPISVEFVIPKVTISGLQVRYLKVTERSGYQAQPWVRYTTQNGDYSIRVANT